MPMHNWTRVSAGTFHDFHGSWISELKKTLNNGLLPSEFYAQSEQIAGQIGPDVLTLKARDTTAEVSADGATAVADAPPKVSYTTELDEIDSYALRRRTLIIRHSSGDEIIALIEVVSPGNKNRQRALDRFLDKATSALADGFHLLIIDPHPPGRYDPRGIHAAMWGDERFQPPLDKTLTLASYSAGTPPRAYVEPIAIGEHLPEMPLFLEEDWYVNVPLESTYMEAYSSVPGRWRRVIEEEQSSD